MLVILFFYKYYSTFYCYSFYTTEVDSEAWEGRLGVLVRNMRTVTVVLRVLVLTHLGCPR